MKDNSWHISLTLRRLQRFFLTTLLGGVVVILPITLFIFIVRWMVKFASSIVSPMRRLFPFAESIPGWVMDLISLSLVIILFFFIGLVVKTRSGNHVFRRFEEDWLLQLPFYATLRDTVRQFFGAKKAPFSQVVLVDAFGSGVLMTGFVSDDNLEDSFITIFVPTGPNPTNGFVFHAKKEQLVYLDAKPEEAMRTIIGVGTGSASALFGYKESE